jgi:hypothetical protein
MEYVQRPKDYFGKWVRYQKNVFSQHGEDGIIEAILAAIGHKSTGWCCEFGAWDGKHLSNTYHLLRHKGWSGLMIEADKEKFLELEKLKQKFGSRLYVRNALVHYTPGKGKLLDSLLAETPIPRDFECLSVDVDGPDYHIWKSLQWYRPKIVLIEHSGLTGNIIQREGAIHKKERDGSTSFEPMRALGESKGYRLLVDTGNLIFLDESYSDLLEKK